MVLKGSITGYAQSQNKIIEISLSVEGHEEAFHY